jgi:hypothetical protein
MGAMLLRYIYILQLLGIDRMQLTYHSTLPPKEHRDPTGRPRSLISLAVRLAASLVRLLPLVRVRMQIKWTMALRRLGSILRISRFEVFGGSRNIGGYRS